MYLRPLVHNELVVHVFETACTDRPPPSPSYDFSINWCSVIYMADILEFEFIRVCMCVCMCVCVCVCAYIYIYIIKNCRVQRRLYS